MKIFSIVVTYNGAGWVERCFGSLVSSDVSNHTIIAIDNDSSDNTVNIIKQMYPTVHIIETGKNLGFGKANNIGLEMAYKEGADYVFLLNQDAWVCDASTISNLISVQKQNIQFGIVSPVHLHDDTSLDRKFISYVLSNPESKFIFDSINKRELDSIYSCNKINAAAWLISKKCIEYNGGFMPIFPHYGEDDNYRKRVEFSGLKIGFVPGVQVIHDRNITVIKTSLKKRINKYYVEMLNRLQYNDTYNFTNFFKDIFRISYIFLHRNRWNITGLSASVVAIIKTMKNYSSFHKYSIKAKTKGIHFLNIKKNNHNCHY